MITDKTIPMKYITAAQPTVPILIMHGTDDVMVPYRQSVELFNCLKEHGQDAELYLLRGANHGGGCFWTSEVLSIVDRFIRRHLVLDNIAE
ncbi:hypothetical protein SDC9_79824 [bioreactor metagenome]|uniref:Peptidase S9 prolyl oligopeptidase catalytic domain-containing protein n=1 Tax=bioreactor metagenome TaxID=1076179 RepID=A0A644Z572_9ZZZZ